MTFDGYYVNYFSNETYGTDVPTLKRTVANPQDRIRRRDRTIDEFKGHIGRRNHEIAVLE